MLDIKLIREKPEKVKANLKRRKDPETIKMFNELRKKDEKRLKLLKEVEDLRKKRNDITREVSESKSKGKKADKKIKEARKVSEELGKKESELEKLIKRCDYLLLRVPNMLHESVPEGEDDADNKEIRKVGKPPKVPEKSHVEILEELGLLEPANDVSGSGFYYLKGKLAVLDYALQRFALDFLIDKGYTPVEPPLMLRREPYEGVTDLDDFENMMYKVEGDDLYLIATSEHPIAAMHKGDTLLKDELPARLAGISPCFRREVGTHGKYTKGLFRTHQFNKVEMFIFSHPDDSWDMHEELQKDAEELYKKLGLHYRVVNVCTGDIGSIAAKKYDIEVWMADGEYREAGSNSNCTDYQARRLGIKWRPGEGKAPAGYVHTLNSTALATSRTMIAIIEQHQKNGGVAVPKPLQKYTGFKALGEE